MPKVTMPTTEEQEILKGFKEGDRVEIDGKHAVFNAYYNGQCWVQYIESNGRLSSSHSANLTDLKLCHCHNSLQGIASQEREGIAKAQLPQDIPLSGQSNTISTLPASLETNSPKPSLLKPTLENLQTNLFPHSPPQTSLSSEVLVQIFPALAIEPELLAVAQACFLKESDFCNFKSLRHSSLKMFPVSSDKTSILSSVPSRNWGMWGIGKNETEGEMSPKTENESSFWVLTGDVRCNAIKENRPSLIDCLDAPGVGIVDRARGGDRTYLDIAPTIRTASVDKNGHQGGSGAFKVIESSGITRPVRPEELEKLMGWEVSSTAFGTTIDGEIVPISNTQRHRMLGNGIIPAEITDICNSLRPFLEARKREKCDASLPPALFRKKALEEAKSNAPRLTTSNEDLQELSIDEECDRHDLERKVEQAFVVAGNALRQLRDKKLYRSTHKTFEEYCKDRFGFTRYTAYNKIAAATVFDNLLTNCQQILPVNEGQIRHLASLEPDEQRQIWAEAVTQSNGKVPTGAKVKGIVEQIKERTAQLPPPDYQIGQVVEIRSGGTKELRKHDGMWGIVSHVGSIRCTVHISLRNVTVQCKPTEMDKVHPMYTADIQAVSERIKELSKLDLNPAVWAILETLAHQTCFDELQMELLEWVEKKYGLSKNVKIEV